MERPTKEVTLPESKAIVVLFANLTGGENRKIKRATYAGIKVAIGENKEQRSETNLAFTLDAEDTALTLLVKEIRNKDNTIVPGDMKLKFIDELSVKDSDFLYDEIDQITKASALSDDQKKN